MKVRNALLNIKFLSLQSLYFAQSGIFSLLASCQQRMKALQLPHHHKLLQTIQPSLSHLNVSI